MFNTGGAIEPLFFIELVALRYFFRDPISLFLLNNDPSLPCVSIYSDFLEVEKLDFELISFMFLSGLFGLYIA
jgi:hypothetical protein